MGHTYDQLTTKYELGDTLGTGAFSEVKVATERATGNKYAIKIVDKSKCKGKESMIETEVNILMRVRHENIIQLYEMFEIDSKIYLVMELVTGGELFDEIVKIGKYTEADAAKIVLKILQAIDYLHCEGIAHRDLKPENLLLSDRSAQAKIMISDFGLSKIFSDDEVMRTACGTPGYVAPEVLRRQGYGREVDLWSLGVITYILLCGYPPFYDQNNVELFKQIMAGRYEFDRPWWDNISDVAKDFIKKLLVLDPRQRFTARLALSHPFILNNCAALLNEQPASVYQHEIAPSINASSASLASRSENVHYSHSAVPPPQPNPDYSQGRSSNSRNSGTSQQQHRHSHNASPASSSPPVQAAAPVHAPAAQAQQPNLGPGFQQNLQKSNSFRSNQQHGNHHHPQQQTGNHHHHQSGHQQAPHHGNHVHPAGAVRLAADDHSQPGRPLGNKNALDDSGCVASNDSISGRKSEASNITQDRLSVQSHSTAVNRSSTSSSQSRPSTGVMTRLHDGLSTRSVIPPIRLLTYNIFLRPPEMKPNTSEHKNARLSAFAARALEAYDIVSLQEMFSSGSSRLSRLLVQAKKTGMEYCCCSPSKGLLNSAYDGGLVILSRFPIVKTERVTFKKGILGDKYCAKGAIYAKISITPHHYVHVINTHLQSSSANASLISLDSTSASSSEKDVASVRMQQIQALKEFIDDCVRKHGSEDDLFIVTGGLNINARASKSRGRQHSKDYQDMVQVLTGRVSHETKEHSSRSSSPMPTVSVARRQPGHSAQTPKPAPGPVLMDLCDVPYEAFQGEHPVTFGDVVDPGKDSRPRETVLTATEALGACASIDYILCLSRKSYERGSRSPVVRDDARKVSEAPVKQKVLADKRVVVNISETRIEKFTVTGEAFTQLSATLAYTY
ncbi:calcium calmodulin-dependent protein kinase type 1G [Dinochytrium kinnereticum]|nr:calcium calmodulin-dependent protein kinase type 1G [Dinochytrium kinnereticum]